MKLESKARKEKKEEKKKNEITNLRWG